MSEAKRRSPEERLAELNKKMEQLKAKKQRIQAQVNEKARKERTRRLIQIGAIFEKRFPKMADLTLEQVSKLADELYKLGLERKGKQEESSSVAND